MQPFSFINDQQMLLFPFFYALANQIALSGANGIFLKSFVQVKIEEFWIKKVLQDM